MACRRDTGTLQGRRLRLPHARRTAIASWRYARDAARAAVIGGGLLGLEAARGLLNRGLEVHVVHLMPHLMDAQLDAAGGPGPAAAARADGHDLPSRDGDDGASSANGRVTGVSLSRTARRSTATWWSSPPASVRTSSSRAEPGSPSNAASSSATISRVAACRRCLRDRRVRRAPRPRLRPRRAAVGTGAGPRRSADRPQSDARLYRLAALDEAEGGRASTSP